MELWFLHGHIPLVGCGWSTVCPFCPHQRKQSNVHIHQKEKNIVLRHLRDIKITFFVDYILIFQNIVLSYFNISIANLFIFYVNGHIDQLAKNHEQNKPQVM